MFLSRFTEQTQLMKRRRFWLLPLFDVPKELEEFYEVVPDGIRLADGNVTTSGFFNNPPKLASALW